MVQICPDFPTMTDLRKIGVLGGMGPEATVLFMQRVVTATQAQDDKDHIPMVVEMNPQTPSRIEVLINKSGISPGPTLAAMAKRLQVSGAQALVMPCNTAHFFASDILDAVNIPLLNMVTLSAQRVSLQLDVGSIVGILASPATMMTGLFDSALKAYGLDTLYPSDQGKLLTAIQRIKSRGPTESEEQTFIDAAQELIDDGAQCLLVGCSEFSLLAHVAPESVPIIDTLDTLVDATVAFSVAA